MNINLRKFLVLFKHNLLKSRNGLILTMMSVCVFISIISLNTVNKLKFYNQDDTGYLFYELFKGAERSADIKSVTIPFIWLIINFLIIIIVSASFSKNYNEEYILTRCSRATYALSNVFFTVFIVTIYYLVIFLTVFFIGVIFLKNNNQIILINDLEISSLSIIIKVIVLYYFTTISLCLIQLIAINRGFSIYMLVSLNLILIISIFLDSSTLIGQHSLLLRHKPFNSSAISINFSLIYNLTISLLVSILNILITSVENILGKKEM